MTPLVAAEGSNWSSTSTAASVTNLASTTAQRRMPFVIIGDGLQIYCEELGSGPAVLFNQGAAGTKLGGWPGVRPGGAYLVRGGGVEQLPRRGRSVPARAP